ncbi:hypothetical protein Tco_1149338 [Tanacetum coccineum]
MTAPSTSHTNDVNTAIPAYEVSTASFSDNAVYAFMVENPNGSNLLHQDLEQIHEDDLEAMDLKWQLSLLSMRANRNVRAQRNKGGSVQKSGNTRKQGNNEDTSSNVMLAINGVGFDWSDIAEEHVQTKHALMVFSDSENEVLFSKEVAVLKREVACKYYEINVLKSEFKKVKQEKEGIEFKIEKFDKASKEIDKLLGSQITDKSKKGLGYSAVPPPHPLIYNRPKKLNLSYSGLDEFKEPEFKGYGSENSKQESNIVCDKKSDDSKENSDNSLVKEQVSKDTSSFVESSLNVDKETVFPVDKKVESVKPKNHEKPVKKSVRYAEMYRSQTPRGNQRNWNGQKSNQLGSDFVMYNKACFICGSFNHVQAQCKYHQRERMVYGNNYNRVNYNYTTNRTHPNAQRNMVPRAVLMKTGLKPFNTARTVNTAHPKSIVFSAKPMSCFPKTSQSTVRRPFQSKTALSIKSTAKYRAHGGRISGKGTLKIVKHVDYLMLNDSPLKYCLRGSSDEAVHKELGDRMERDATTTSRLEAEQDGGSGPRCQDTILGDVDAQTRSPFWKEIEVSAGNLKLNAVGFRPNLVLPVQVNAAEGDSINTSIQGFIRFFI